MVLRTGLGAAFRRIVEGARATLSWVRVEIRPPGNGQVSSLVPFTRRHFLGLPVKLGEVSDKAAGNAQPPKRINEQI